MNNLYTDVKYIEIINLLGDYLKENYNLSQIEIQTIKFKINSIIKTEVE